MTLRPLGLAILGVLALPSLARARSPKGEDPSAAATEACADANTPAPPKRWLERWAPEPMTIELGVYGGALLPTPNLELFSPDYALPDQGFRELDGAVANLGVRAGFYPLEFFGVEAEGGVLPAGTQDDAGAALLYTIRGQLVGQLGPWNVTPFVLVGAGALGVSSERAVLGDDVDPALHYGAGVKVYVNRYVGLRLDVRDVVSYERGVDNYFSSHSPEVLLGVSITLGRAKDELRPPPDELDRELDPERDLERDLDGDGDGLIDRDDRCPAAAETYNDYQDDDGCPEADEDGDGLFDDQDMCPTEAETLDGEQDDDGCPEPDPDAGCPADADACPEEVPRGVDAITGTPADITFDNDSDTIQASSWQALDEVVRVLQDNPGVRLRINGHTDDRGDHAHNVDLSRRRAEAVKTYLVDHGVDASRIETAGYGPDVPIDTNDSEAGRANNRRIEFEIIAE